MRHRQRIHADSAPRPTSDFGRRLCEERARLGFSQHDFAEIGGVKRTAQYLYEKGVRSPDANYLAKIFDAGADVGYLISGQPTPTKPIGAVVAIAEALAAYRAVDAFVDTLGESASPLQRERLFVAFCGNRLGRALETDIGDPLP